MFLSSLYKYPLNTCCILVQGLREAEMSNKWPLTLSSRDGEGQRKKRMRIKKDKEKDEREVEKKQGGGGKKGHFVEHGAKYFTYPIPFYKC